MVRSVYTHEHGSELPAGDVLAAIAELRIASVASEVFRHEREEAADESVLAVVARKDRAAMEHDLRPERSSSSIE